MDQLSNIIKTEVVGSLVRESDWKSEDILTVISMYNKKYSMSVIGNEVNRTRNAVAGLINRLRKRGSKAMPRRAVTGAPRAKVIPMQPKPRVIFMPQMLSNKPEQKTRIRLKLIENNSVTFKELELRHCRWPIGDPRRSDFRFCGCSRVSLSHRTPYCAQHAVIAGKRYEKDA